MYCLRLLRSRDRGFESHTGHECLVCVCFGRAIAQAVSRWFPTTAARLRARVWICGICGGQSGAGAGFLRVLRFPLPIFIPPYSTSSQSPGVGTLGHSVADVPSGPSLDSTPPHMRINKKQSLCYNGYNTKIVVTASNRILPC
jgi:hypothetical protein